MIGSKNVNEKRDDFTSAIHTDIALLVKLVFEYLIYTGTLSFKVFAKCADSFSRDYRKYVDVSRNSQDNYFVERKIRMCDGIIEYDLLHPLVDNILLEHCFDLYTQRSVGEGIGLGYKPDVSLCCGNKLIKAIEIFYTHSTTEEKTTWYNAHRNDVINIDVSDLDDSDLCALWTRWEEDNDVSILHELNFIVSMNDVSTCYIDKLIITRLPALRNSLLRAKNRINAKAVDYVDREYAMDSFTLISTQKYIFRYSNDIDVNTLCFAYYKGIISADEWEWYYIRTELVGYWHSWHAFCDEDRKRLIESKIHNYINKHEHYGKKARLFKPSEINEMIRKWRHKKYARFHAMLPRWEIDDEAEGINDSTS